MDGVNSIKRKQPKRKKEIIVQGWVSKKGRKIRNKPL